MSYKHPAFSVGDHVEFMIETETKKTAVEGVIVELELQRHEGGKISGWRYKVAHMNEDKLELLNEDQLRGRMLVLRQFTKRM